MIDVLYSFIRNTLIGETTISGADNLALMLTWFTLIMFFILLIRLVMWAFFIVFRWSKKNYRS